MLRLRCRLPYLARESPQQAATSMTGLWSRIYEKPGRVHCRSRFGEYFPRITTRSTEGCVFKMFWAIVRRRQ